MALPPLLLSPSPALHAWGGEGEGHMALLTPAASDASGFMAAERHFWDGI